MLAGFEHPDGGAVRIGGVDVTAQPPYRRDVNTVFQHYALFPHMTVEGNVGYGLRQRGLPREDVQARVDDALSLVQLSGFGARRPNQLSGGQQQRVALARAIVNRPSVLLLDEPLGALDRKLRQQMQVELKLLQRRLGLTFVYVTHDQEEALSMADRIAVMERGRLAQVGTPDEIYDRPASLFVAGFVGLQNFFSGTIDASGNGWVLEAPSCRLIGERMVGTLQAGQSAVAAVRPEVIRIAREDPGRAQNVAAGTLASTLPLGDTVQHVVLLADGRELLVRRPRLDCERLEPGDRLWCTWEPGSVQVFSAEAVLEPSVAALQAAQAVRAEHVAAIR
jgi:spermidine/putrescine transport system ATP-binding protein